MAAITVDLPSDLEKFVHEKVEEGNYHSEADYLRSILQAARENEQPVVEDMPAEELARLRAELEIGLRDIREGRSGEFNPQEMIQDCRKTREERKK